MLVIPSICPMVETFASNSTHATRGSFKMEFSFPPGCFQTIRWWHGGGFSNIWKFSPPKGK